MSLLIGLMGQKRSGKDTFGARLVEQHGFVRLANADVMKDCMIALNPLVPDPELPYSYRLAELIEEGGWELSKERFPEIRRLLQVFGTEVGRNILGSDVWVNAMRGKVQALQDKGRNVVITDVRFPNEGDLVTSLGGDIVRINRPGLPDDDTHASEIAWRDITADWIFENDSDIPSLNGWADYMVGRKLARQRESVFTA